MDETLVINDVKELLPIENADPWHKLSALEHDCVLIVEFSELEGPKPAFCIPQCPGVHFEPNDFAVWLMTADYQMTNHRTTESNFGVNKDIQMMLVNEEQGVYTYAHHFTLFDIEARGFFRPFCASYVTVDETKLSFLFENLRQEFSDALERIKNCNRRQFLKELTEAVEALSTVENQAISSYYELYYDQKTSEKSSNDASTKKPEVLNLRYRRLQRELENVHKLVSTYLNGNRNNSSSSSPVCTNHQINMDPWITTLRKGEGVETRKTMKDFKALCPCLYDDFCVSVRSLWNKYRHWNDYCSLFLSDNGSNCSRVNLETFPLLFLPNINEKNFNGNPTTNDLVSSTTIAEIDAIHYLSESTTSSDEKNHDEQSRLLISLGSKLPHLLYPLLIGQFMLIFGGEQRKETVKSLINKLKQFSPNLSSSTHLCYKWHEGSVPPQAYGEFKLFGLHVPKNFSVDNYLASNMKSFIAMMDLNSDTFHASEYVGVVMNCLSSKSLYNLHPSDRTLTPFVLSVISKFAILAFVLYYHIYGDNYQSNGLQVNQLMNTFASTFSLSKKDLRIVKYFVELIKLQRKSSSGAIIEPVESAFDSIFLNYEPVRSLKL